ncbi:MAG: hypothetical protein KH164_07375 [Veillonella sp.]|jgi:hypothetical protein|uniref:hypothetical protein n=1 Tax=Veillonella sp. TaxID=1926307 RepID=UPI002580606E|nr:hypothetical protein [Veillonella sp.]MBS6893140.1 hypothetical protein [Veillonella sp.]
MRKSYFEILEESSLNLDLSKELGKLEQIIHEPFWVDDMRANCSLYMLIEINFKDYRNRKHFLTIEELIDDLLLNSKKLSIKERYFLMAEMYLDLLSSLHIIRGSRLDKQVRYFSEQVQIVSNAMGHKLIRSNGRIIIVEDNVFANEAAQVVTEFTDEKEALSILEYNHFSNKGNIERKKEILKKIADLLEPWRKPFNKCDELKGLLKVNNDKIQALERLFYMYNKFNIRHNNEEQKLTRLSNREIESWYDKIYTMSLFVILGKDVAQILADFNEFVD